MKKLFLLLFLIFTFYGFAEGQQIRKITGTRTYFYPPEDSIPPTVIDSNTVLEYDNAGRLLRDQDIEGVCYQDYLYDKLGRKIVDNAYCGEGFMECTTTYQGNFKFDTCYSAMHFYVTIDSLNEAGWPIKSDSRVTESPNDPNDTTKTFYRNISYYKYDHEGREISVRVTDSMGNLTSRVTRNYNEKGLLTSYVSYSYSQYYDYPTADSAIYEYDSNNRLIHAQNFSHLNKNYQFEVIQDLKIAYPVFEAKKSADNRKLNNKILTVPYSEYDFEITYTSMPAEIKYIVTDQYSSDGYMEKDVLFAYSYDKKGRLEQIVGTGTHYRGLKYSLDHSVTYPRPNKAVMVCNENDSRGYPVTGDVYEYENGLLKKITEKDSTGFIYATTVFSYELFK